MLRKLNISEGKSEAWEGDRFDTMEVIEPFRPTEPTSHKGAEPLPIHRLRAGDTLTVRTRNNSYRLIILDSVDQKILIRGGRFFPQPTEATLLGAAVAGRIEIGHLVMGRGLGIAVGHRCIQTSPVMEMEQEDLKKTGTGC